MVQLSLKLPFPFSSALSEPAVGAAVGLRAPHDPEAAGQAMTRRTGSITDGRHEQPRLRRDGRRQAARPCQQGRSERVRPGIAASAGIASSPPRRAARGASMAMAATAPERPCVRAA